MMMDEDGFGFVEEVKPPPKATTRFEAKPFEWKPASQAPKRQWLYGSFLMRGTVSLTVAPGGVGKSMLSISEALSMATGYGKLHDWVHRRCRVWLFNLEDSEDELERRFLGACKLYRIGKPDLDGYLFVNSGHGTPLVIAHQDKNGLKIAKPVVEALVAEITAKGVDVVIIDPFVSCHQASENDNNAIDAVAKTWATIANRTGCAVHLVHHSRKTNGTEVQVEDSRGASALINAVRSARALNPMTKSQAQEAGIEDSHWSYVQISDGKANFAPRAETSKWFKLESVDLENGGAGNLELGDRVGVPVTWSWPEPAKLSDDDRGRILEHLTTEGPWRKDPQAGAWVGYGVIDALKLDRENKAHKAQAKSIIKELIRAEALTIVKGEDARRNMRDFVEVLS